MKDYCINEVQPAIDETEGGAAPLLTVLLPTKDESANIPRLLTAMLQALEGIPCEIIFIDDSTDNTAQVILDEARRYASPISIRVIHRAPELRHDGLSGAVVLGMREARGDWVCVMDSDLQHPPSKIPSMLRVGSSGNADLVVASRMAENSGFVGLSWIRQACSRALIFLMRLAFWRSLRYITDPLTGFFLVRRDALNLDHLEPKGYKILFEIVARTPGLTIKEVPFSIQKRHAGESKVDTRVVWHFVSQCIGLKVARITRMATVAGVGVMGILLNHWALGFYVEQSSVHYFISALVATQFSILWNVR